MPLICPQCSQVNQESTVFCRTCGYRFQGNEKEVADEATIRQPNLAAVPANADPSETLKPGASAAAQSAPASSATSAAPVMQTPQPPISVQGTPAFYRDQPPSSAPGQSPFFAQSMPPAQGGYAPQQQQQQQVYGQYAPAQQGPYGAPVPQAAAPATSATFKRAFAGKGTPVHHQSWLVEGKQVAPQTLTGSFINNLQKQGVMGVSVFTERLHEQGVVMEERDYVRVRYGTSSVFVYVAPMGQNLYISRTSTIQQPYSRVRIAVLASLAVLMLISLILFAVLNSSIAASLAASNVGSYYALGAFAAFFEYAFFGLLFFFIIALLRSVVFWLTDNDFLAVLRPNRLSDFSLDALASIERTTDKALQVTLQEAGLETDVIELAHSTTPQQPLHRI